MNKILAKIDQIIEKIPVHFRDIIKKIFFLIVGLTALIAIIIAIQRGMENATPGGAKLFQKNEDFFYIDKLKEENKKKNRLIEDIEVYNDLFESNDERIHPSFRSLGKDTEDRLIGEKEEFIKKPDILHEKGNNLLLEDDTTVEYEKPLPDDYKAKRKSEDTPFIEGDKTDDSIQKTKKNNRINIDKGEVGETDSKGIRKGPTDFID